MRGPGIPAGQTRDALVQNVDYAPTFVEWARASAPVLDGRSFASIAGTGSPTGARSDMLLEHWKAGRGTGIPDFFGLQTTDYAYVEVSTGEFELYDMHEDPYELANQYFANPTALLKQLSDRVAALKACQGASCR